MDDTRFFSLTAGWCLFFSFFEKKFLFDQLF